MHMMSEEKIGKELHAEIEAALGNASIEDLVEDAPHQRKRGEARTMKTGVVAAIHGSNVLVEFGPRTQGSCPKLQFEILPNVGDSLEFVVERTDKDGMLVLSRQGAIQKANWDALETGQIVEALCTGTNKGGLDMELASHKAFMPAGHVELYHVPDLSIFTGQKFACEVIELDRSKNRIVLSRRAVLKAEQKEKQQETLENLEVGATVDATITSIKPYGAFADIGGIEGLIHISEISWERISDPSKFVKSGDLVRVQILDIDHEHSPPKIALGMKQLIEDPMVATLGTIEVGENTTGTVTRLAAFGAFVDIGGVEGLVHISELSHQRIKSAKDAVREGEVVTVRVLSIDPTTRRIALSLKQAQTETSGEDTPTREDDPAIRKLREKFGGSDLKGGIDYR
jgi:small subunit ribosomal protein S1